MKSSWSNKVTRRTLLKTTAAAAIGLPGLGRVRAQDLPARRPNLVYILADQLRHESVGYTGDARALTPNLDRLADEGTSFENMVSTMPVCAAYRASLLTGRYPSTHGLVINEYRLNPNQRCLGHVLTEAGYRTGFVGKWHMYAPKQATNPEVYRAFIPPGPDRLGFDGLWAAYNFNHQYYKGFYYRDEPTPVEVDGYEPDVQTDMAIDFIRERAREPQPFALILSVGTPHPPCTESNVPREWLDRFADVKFELPPNFRETPDPYMDRFTDPERWRNYWKPNLPDMMRVYYAMTANLDWNVGRVIETLKTCGVEDDTIVVFTSDHGEMFGQQGRVQKLTFYEAAARVPFLIRWPGRIPAGVERNACAGTVDIMPTLLGLMGLPIPSQAEGMDLSRLAQGQRGPEPEAAFLQGMGHTYLWENGFEWRAARDKRFTYARYRRDGKELLFDNLKDPLQMTNVVNDPDYTAHAQRLRAWMQDKMDSLQDTFEPFTWYRDHWFDQRWSLRGAKG